MAQSHEGDHDRWVDPRGLQAGTVCIEPIPTGLLQERFRHLAAGTVAHDPG